MPGLFIQLTLCNMGDIDIFKPHSFLFLFKTDSGLVSIHSEGGLTGSAFGSDHTLASATLTGVSGYSSELVKGFRLYQNYPNPFNPTTQIKYQIPNTIQVSLKVYDVLGREVITLVDEVKPRGDYELQWNAGRMVTGVYFYRLIAGSSIVTKKLLLLK